MFGHDEGGSPCPPHPQSLILCPYLLPYCCPYCPLPRPQPTLTVTVTYGHCTGIGKKWTDNSGRNPLQAYSCPCPYSYNYIYCCAAHTSPCPLLHPCPRPWPSLCLLLYPPPSCLLLPLVHPSCLSPRPCLVHYSTLCAFTVPFHSSTRCPLTHRSQPASLSWPPLPQVVAGISDVATTWGLYQRLTEVGKHLSRPPPPSSYPHL